jgi:hypothetical protein
VRGWSLGIGRVVIRKLDVVRGVVMDGCWDKGVSEEFTRARMPRVRRDRDPGREWHLS